MNEWCVAYTQPLKELVAKEHILGQGFEVYLPRFKKVRRHARKVDEVLLPLFPRYIFVGVDLETARWRGVNGTRGVSYLLMSNDHRPARIPLQVIAELKSQEISDELVSVGSLAAFVRGDKVRMLEGIFKDHLAIFEALDDQGRVRLLLDFLGRETKLSFPGYAVEAV